MNDSVEKLKLDLVSKFKMSFGTHECIKFAPGRANIIGEHTDYNEGFVLPFAIDKGLFFVAGKNDENVLKISAIDTHEDAVIDLRHDSHELKFGWEKFFIQILKAMSKYDIHGINLVFGGNLPIGAGISSSSAITCGLISVLNELYGLEMDAAQMVRKAVEAEVGYGVRGGMMDQFTIINGKENQCILLDCRDLSYQYLELNLENAGFYLINTNVKHNLIDTDYNNRRSECEKALELINKYFKPKKSLREVELDELSSIEPFLDARLFNRVKFVVEENTRVLEAKKMLDSGNMMGLGELLFKSHKGLRELYQVSCLELDWLVEFAQSQKQILGARMMGGGFGGCTINLIEGGLDIKSSELIKSEYFKAFGFYPTIISIKSGNGLAHSQHI